MPLKRSILIFSTLLGLTLAAACGTPRASYPPAPTQIPVRAELRLPCEGLATPLVGELPPLAGEDTEARRVQLAERAFWMEFDLAHNGLEARACSRYLELLALVDAYNASARAAAESWPR